MSTNKLTFKDVDDARISLMRRVENALGGKGATTVGMLTNIDITPLQWVDVNGTLFLEQVVFSFLYDKKDWQLVLVNPENLGVEWDFGADPATATKAHNAGEAIYWLNVINHMIAEALGETPEALEAIAEARDQGLLFWQESTPAQETA